MKSPKFEFTRPSLRATFNKSLLKEDWTKRVKVQIRKQAVMDLTEYRDLDDVISTIIDGVIEDVLSATYQVAQSKQFLIEKSKGLCRQMTLIHPRDLLTLERLSRSIYPALRASAPSKRAFFEPDDGQFKVITSTSDDFTYGSTFASWKRFQRAVFGFSSENRNMVITDVANFYDFINFNHLRNIIAEMTDAKEAVLDLLLHILNRLTWVPDFMPLTNIGMPQIEASAPRVLANAMLYEVDRVCEKYSFGNYARFMDDIDLGANSIAEAKRAVRNIDLTLQSRQLRLNSSKTRILDQPGAFDHFCITENQNLDS